MLRRVIPIIAIAIISGCDRSPGRYELEDFVKANLKDPDSAKFSDLKFYRNRDRHVLCGYVNARNSMGGMVGDTKFYAWKNTTRTAGDVALAPIRPTAEESSRFEGRYNGFCQTLP